MLAGSLPAIAVDADSQPSVAKVTKKNGKLIANVQTPGSETESKEKDQTKESNKDQGKDHGTDQAKDKDKTDTSALEAKEAQSYFEQERSSRKRKYAHASSTVNINAPQAVVWQVLIDFERYPEYFKRIDTCHITKREHGLLYAETYLKPQMFVKKLCQHTVSDISQGPTYLQWKMLDGNFTSVVGSWHLATVKDKKGNAVCEAQYTLEADPGPVIPSPLVSFLLHQIEHEVVSNFKKACEQTYAEKKDKTDKPKK